MFKAGSLNIVIFKSLIFRASFRTSRFTDVRSFILLDLKRPSTKRVQREMGTILKECEHLTSPNPKEHSVTFCLLCPSRFLTFCALSAMSVRPSASTKPIDCKPVSLNLYFEASPKWDGQHPVENQRGNTHVIFYPISPTQVDQFLNREESKPIFS